MNSDDQPEGELRHRTHALRLLLVDALERAEAEWDLTPTEIVGVLETLKLDLYRAHMEEDSDD